MAARRRNARIVTLALPERRNCRTVRWRILTGQLRGLHFKPDGGGYNVAFASERQILEAIEAAKNPDQLDPAPERPC